MVVRMRKHTVSPWVDGWGEHSKERTPVYDCVIYETSWAT